MVNMSIVKKVNHEGSLTDEQMKHLFTLSEGYETYEDFEKDLVVVKHNLGKIIKDKNKNSKLYKTAKQMVEHFNLELDTDVYWAHLGYCVRYKKYNSKGLCGNRLQGTPRLASKHVLCVFKPNKLQHTIYYKVVGW